jgi:hypothetical protein
MIAKLNEPTLDENVLANNGNDVGLGLSWIAVRIQTRHVPLWNGMEGEAMMDTIMVR